MYGLIGKMVVECGYQVSSSSGRGYVRVRSHS
jgi:hypothetical protein